MSVNLIAYVRLLLIYKVLFVTASSGRVWDTQQTLEHGRSIWLVRNRDLFSFKAQLARRAAVRVISR